MVTTRNTSSVGRIAEGSRFYSPLQNAIAGVPDRLRIQPAGQWLAWLKANAGKLGVKQDEVAWSGIEDYLTLRDKDKVTQDEIASFLSENGTQVKGVLLGAPITTLPEGWTVEQDRYGNWQVLNDKNVPVTTPQRTKDGALAGMPKSVIPTKYDKYVVPGGENYRELLITLPAIDYEPEIESLRDKYIASRASEAPKVAEELAAIKAKRDSTQFKSSHFDRPNILTHLRFDDRVDGVGRKTLMIHEIQSDWGQAAKKIGVIRAPVEKARYDLLRDKWLTNSLTEIEGAEFDKLSEAGHAQNNGVPAAPFITNTKAWVGLATKRAIVYAVENGYESVVFINGDQAADLYDLSKQVSRVAWNPTSGDLTSILPDKISFHSIATQVSADRLDQYIGKDAAEKLRTASMNDKGYRIIAGDDLKVGGQGMNIFYDQIVPQVVNDVLHKLGGEKLGLVRLNGAATYEQLIAAGKKTGLSQAELDAMPVGDRKALIDSMLPAQLGFEITPTLRERVLRDGVPLFQGDRGALDTGTLTMTLFANADESTFIHEAGHFYLEVLSDVAAQANPPARVVADMGAILEWLKVPGGLAAWQKMPLDAEPPALCKRPFHEQFARGMEAYLMTGKAPTPETEGLFARAAKFLANVYSSVRGLDVELTPQVTSVFDRLVALTSIRTQLETDVVRQRLESQLTAIDRFPADVNATYAGLVANFYGGLASASGITATELAKKYPLQVRSDVHGLVPEGMGKARTDTPEFKAWFGDSKVVDDERKPFVVYHGTDRKVDQFNLSESGFYGAGVYFSASQATAQEFGEYKLDDVDSSVTVIPVYLSLQNPYIFHAPRTFAEPSHVSLAKELFEGSELNKVLKVLNSKHWDNPTNEFKDKLNSMGYDGLIVCCPGEPNELIAFYPEQIKSVFNRGTFDRSNPNILFQPAYHGSPHEFEQFKMECVGTGEGRQQQAVGLYFAENKQVGQRYADRLADQHGKDQGHLYKVDLPVEAIDRLAAYEQPLGQQPDTVKAAMTALIGDEVRSNLQGYYGWQKADEAPFAAILGALDIAHGNNRAATAETLKNAGIPGVRYLDSHSRGTEQATHNIVCFSDDIPRILEIDGRATGAVPWARGEWQPGGQGKAAVAALPDGVAVVDKGLYYGKVVDVTSSHVIQDSGRGKLVAHEKSAFASVPAINSSMEIGYRDGRIALAKPIVRTGAGLGR